MEYSKLGKTELFISRIGFGAWGIGGKTIGKTSYGNADDNVSVRALKTAFDRGINFYDTSNVYGDGHSEELIGKVFSSKRDKVILATKAGMLPHYSGFDFSSKHIRSSLMSSLKRLKTDYVDLLQLHNPHKRDLSENTDLIAELVSLQSEGKIRHWGISCKSPDDALHFLDLSDCVSFQVNFNLLDWRCYENGLMSKLQNNRVAIIARTPLASGFLSGKITPNTIFNESDHRSKLTVDKITTLLDVAKRMIENTHKHDENITPIQLALRFCLSFDSISSVIPGMMTEQEVILNSNNENCNSLRDMHIMELLEIYRHNKHNLNN